MAPGSIVFVGGVFPERSLSNLESRKTKQKGGLGLAALGSIKV
jgi:hypothetical protein